MVGARTFWPAAALAASLAVAGCKRNETRGGGPEVTAAGGGRDAAAIAARPPRPTLAGMKAPFEPRTPALANSFAAGLKAYRARNYGEALQLFHEIVGARPDDTAARYQELRAAVRADPNADLREPLRALLFRDFVGYDHRLRTGKEFAPLWTSPRASELEAIRADARAAYADKLAAGAFFVGRNRSGQPALHDEAGKSVLDLALEAYELDPASGLVRRLSDTGGRVAGMRVDRGGRILVLLLVNELVPSNVETGLSFAGVSGEVLSLETLETLGPIALPIAANATQIELCTTAKREARWIVGEARFAIDATKRRAVAIKRDDCAPGATEVTPEGGSFKRPVDSSPDAGAVDLRFDGGARSIKITDLERNASARWSPGRSRLAFAGQMDPCSLAPAGWPLAGMNNLYAWDVAAAVTIRLATAFSFFEYDWLDDDRLAYEGSTPKGGKIVVHDFRTQADAVLDVPAGAGISAVPSFECVATTVETGEDPEGE